MIFPSLLWIVVLSVMVIGWLMVQLSKVWEWALLGTFLFLCTQVSYANAPPRYTLVKMTEDAFVELTRHSTHFDCMDAMHSQVVMAKAASDVYGNETVVGFLCEPPVPEPVARVIPVCKARIERCA